ncbi:MAG: hypothetical protein HFE39_07455, partial [Clostridiales bacterium]|nr:hypothetical protein [Clostridiales bacterium]
MIYVDNRAIRVRVQVQQGDQNATAILFAIPNPGTPNLNLCRFYSITDQSGTLDKIPLLRTVDGSTLQILWTLDGSLTAQAGLVRYQLV